MKTFNSKLMTNKYQDYTQATATTLQDVYNSYSCAKQNAYNRCRRLMNEYNGYGLKIIGHNCNTFSVGFMGYINDDLHFFYITRNYDRCIRM